MTSHPTHKPSHRLPQIGWLLYEFANQPYFTLINIFLFANYFANQLALDPASGQAAWGYTQACAGLFIAVLSPLFGSIADATGRRKPWIVVFLVLAVTGCFGLWFAVPGASLIWVGAGVIMAAISLEFIITFCNAILPDIATGRRLSLLSGIGFGLAQLAGILVLVLVLILFQLPGRVEAGFIPAEPFLGLDRGQFEHERIVGPIAGLWLLVFMLPLLFWVRDRGESRMSPRRALKAGIDRLRATVRDASRHKNTMRYLVARMIYNDGLQAVFAFGGVIAGTVLGWGALELAVFGVLVTLFAGLGGVLSAFIDARIGSRPTIILFLTIVCLVSLGLVSFQPTSVFFVFDFADVGNRTSPFSSTGEMVFIALACIFGFASGPITASSRTLMAKLAPEGMAGEFFGLYALSGKATAFAAPLAVAIVTSATGNTQWGLGVIVGFLLVGFWLFWPVQEQKTPSA